MREFSEKEYTLEEEFQFIQGLLDPKKKERYESLYNSIKSRKKFVHALAHNNVFNVRYIHKLKSSEDSVENTLKALTSKGASNIGYVISEDSQLDRKVMPIEDALIKIRWSMRASVVCCIPGKLLYYEDEPPSQRYLIEAK